MSRKIRANRELGVKKGFEKKMKTAFFRGALLKHNPRRQKT